jgi:hypothetical protein
MTSATGPGTRVAPIAAGKNPRGLSWLVRSGALILLALGALAGCADKQVAIRYQPDPTLERLTAPDALTIFDFSDQRGSEGDKDIFRVGGVYVGVWTRLVKVMTDTPWPRTLSRALAEAFTGRGVPVTIAYQPFAPGSTFSTPFALAGEIRNFSTEFRFGTAAHISGVVRLYDRRGAILIERRISERQTWDMEMGAATSDAALQATLNRALAGFVSRIVTDPDIDGFLTRPTQRP